MLPSTAAKRLAYVGRLEINTSLCTVTSVYSGTIRSKRPRRYYWNCIRFNRGTDSGCSGRDNERQHRSEQRDCHHGNGKLYSAVAAGGYLYPESDAARLQPFRADKH